jgi:hypothetical protein
MRRGVLRVTFAVLFKIYFLDLFVVRQLERLKAVVGPGDLYVVVDETKGAIDLIPHDKVVRVTEADMIRRGFAHAEPRLSMFWHSADYSLFPLIEDLPPYDYYVTVEYDAVINENLDRLVDAIAAQKIEFAGLRTTQPVTEWDWTKTVDTIYDPAVLRPYLNAIAFYSRRGVTLLRDRRLELSRRFNAGEITQFPMSEAFIATEMELHGYRVGNLADFGNFSRYTWWPPTVEAELGELRHCTFIHPVLEGERCAAALLRPDKLPDLFMPGWVVPQRLARLKPRDYIPKLLPILLHVGREMPATLASIDLPAPLFERPDPSPNIALGKPATQSSTCAQSRNIDLRADAGGAVNGMVTGTFGFHTGHDDPPWWMVDLETHYHLTGIWIFNRLDVPSNLQHFRIFISGNGRDWATLVDHRSDGNYGGAWGEPLMIEIGEDAIPARFVRIELGGPGVLHLDQVKIFGSPAHAKLKPL